jgi:hypothetical protein
VAVVSTHDVDDGRLRRVATDADHDDRAAIADGSLVPRHVRQLVHQRERHEPAEAGA